MDGKFHKRRGDYEEYDDSYSYRGYHFRRCSQTLGTTSRSLSYINLKLPLLCGTFDSYDYEALEQKVESFFYSYDKHQRSKIPHAIIEAKEIVEIHVENKTSNEDPCYIMSEKNIESKEKERVDKERLVERSCNFDSISIFQKRVNILSVQKRKRMSLRKTNSFFASEFLCVHNFEDSSKDERGKLSYKFIKTINVFLSNSDFSFC
ncbi:hypothetical protein M9H77_07535 [Catharanthus roseus]|uniref:Uncharacterized protein n=1 Tax=Catharanthus roseus TaxID=4058 RepID=A0ACC0BV93_CATRO|nr:hypothetical protein M9H77_07535 [Catharanthus roseus]